MRIIKTQNAHSTAIEELLRIGFEPSRSVVLAYGIDEERGGIEVRAHAGLFLLSAEDSYYGQGATAIRDHLLKTYGEDSFSILIDEGGK